MLPLELQGEAGGGTGSLGRTHPSAHGFSVPDSALEERPCQICTRSSELIPLPQGLICSSCLRLVLPMDKCVPLPHPLLLPCTHVPPLTEAEKSREDALHAVCADCSRSAGG